MSNCMHSSATVKSAPRTVFSFPHAAYSTKPAECTALEAISMAVKPNNKILALKLVSFFSLAQPPMLSLSSHCTEETITTRFFTFTLYLLKVFPS